MLLSRRLTLVALVTVVAVIFFMCGAFYAGRLDAHATASYDARLDALRAELAQAMARDAQGRGVTGTAGFEHAPNDRSALIAEIKDQLRHEMGLLPVSLLRERRSSFVELHAYDDAGEKSYGTAGYLGHGYFVTVKHAVVTLPESGAAASGRRTTSIKVVYQGKEIPARLIDAGTARREVDPGDWAIIRTRPLDLPPLTVDAAFAYEFAEPIFRLGNDYSKGIVASTGYVGQRTDAGLVTALTDGHPGVSGGGVLDQRGVLVGIPIGRMQGDYRFSFILPIRQEMLRKVPAAVAAASLASNAAP